MEIQLETLISSGIQDLEDIHRNLFKRECEIRIDKNRVRGKVISVKAFEGENLVGLGIAEFDQRKKESEILSVFVRPEYRHKRIGSQIIKSLSANLEENGFQKVSLVFQSNIGSYTYMKYHLGAHGWHGPEEINRVFVVDISKRKDEVLALELPVAQTVGVETWENQGQYRFDKLRDYLKANEDLPSHLNPFREEKDISPKCSMLAIDQDRIVGWNICYEKTEDSREYSNLYIDKDYRSRGLVWSLFVSSVKMQSSLNIPIIVGVIDVENSAILDYYIRRISNNQFDSHSHYRFTRSL